MCSSDLGLEGLLDILAAVDRIESDYARACRAARAVAEESLEATKVCRRFLEDVGL